MIHKPVLINKVLKYWVNKNFIRKKADIILVDATCGEGGHSLALLKKAEKENWLKKLKLICIDCDSEILAQAKNNLKQFRDHVFFVNNNYANLDVILRRLEIKKIHGILFDLGASMYHFKKSKRGFSFRSNDFLDMRYDIKVKNTECKIKNQGKELTAYEIVNKFSENKIKDIIQKLGEEKWAKRIAYFIVQKRKEKTIKTVEELTDIILEAIPKKFRFKQQKIGKARLKKIHPATKTFQALRIFVNDELKNISQGLNRALANLEKGGRILIISFHSLEDRIAKQFIKEKSEPKKDKIYGKIIVEPHLKIITKKPVTAGVKEIAINTSARSAKLRIAQKQRR